ncbi:MFS transporter [Chamaesiphon polymorphus]|uniref:MFS transporter n=1 Tax=Chamaesiphon polymorphus CCALA 037 TaxID=2107692 RepID=A0A2T1GH28_9CYAN|nr:MFS transporter [Chamaesiphon polymorphus]PSB56980.1 MFS transporter [Chamaesiphon polymorphus CCALA 037]
MRLDSPKERLHQRLPYQVWILSISSLLVDISAEMIRSVLPIFVLLKLQGGAMTIGEIEGISAATVAIMRVFSGGLSDYLGMQKGLAVVGYGIATLMRSLLPIALDPIWVIWTQFGDRFGQGISVAPRKALMADLTSEETRSKAYRLRQSLLIAGACIGSIIAGAILYLDPNGYKLIFASAVIPSCMGLALLILVVKPVQKPRKLLTLPAEMTGLLAGNDEFYSRVAPSQQHRNVSSSAITTRHSERSDSLPSYNPIYWRDVPALGGEYWLLAIAAIFFNLGNSSDAFMLMKSIDIGMSPAFIPVGLVVMNLVFALVSYPISSLVLGLSANRDNRSLKIRLLLTGFLLHAIVYFGLAVVTTNVQIWCLFGLYGLHLAMIQGLTIDLVSRSVEPSRRGTALSLFNLTIGITLLIANLIAGWCWLTIGSGFTFTVGAFFACIATLILLIGSEE